MLRLLALKLIGIFGLLVPTITFALIPVVTTTAVSDGAVAEIVAWTIVFYLLFFLPWTITNVFLILSKYLSSVRITKDGIFYRVGIITWQIQRKQIVGVNATNNLKKLKAVRVVYIAKDQVARSIVIPTLLFDRLLYKDLLNTADVASETFATTRPPSRASASQLVSWLVLGLVVGAAACFSLFFSIILIFLQFVH